MALTPRLEIRQSQTLVMTPQLQQAIKLLQLSNLELAAFVEQEIEKNPLLEMADEDGRREGAIDGAAGETKDGAAPESAEGGPAEADEQATDEQGADSRLNDSGDAGDSGDAPLDIDMSNVYNNDSVPDTVGGDGTGHWSTGGGGRGDGEGQFDSRYGGAETLRDHLEEQLPGAFSDAAGLALGRSLIESLNDDGYLADSVEVVAERLGCPVTVVEAALAMMQGFSPVGVFARDLKECLALQLRDRDRYDPAMATFVENLELLAENGLPQLRRLCGVSQEDLFDMVDEIRALNPKPGAGFTAEPVQSLVPDVFVRQKSDGGWGVELNNETLPRVLVNQRYYSEIAGAARTEKDKTYLADCLSSANWLTRALDQRARTILKVSTEIVRQQDGFFAHGVEHLRPLNLRTIAEAIEMHESTVSRVTNNKYLATGRGIFELKYFFTSGVSCENGESALSAEAIRHKIREMVDNESPDDILSDDKMVEVLRAAGIDIARRTVAKYRESIHIPSSVQRRRQKRMGRTMKAARLAKMA